MEQKTRSALTRQRILDAAMAEFSSKGYEGASLNAACAENGFSKGVVYHHFKDKNELYLLCVQRCFNAVTERLKEAAACLSGTAEERLCDNGLHAGVPARGLLFLRREKREALP